MLLFVLSSNNVCGQADKNAERPQNLIENPRRAVHTFFTGKGHERPDLVAQTMQFYDGADRQKVEHAEKLRQVLDSRGPSDFGPEGRLAKPEGVKITKEGKEVNLM